MIIQIVLGLVIGILSSGSGLGGGFLVVPYLIYMGKAANIAVGTSFLFVGLVAVSSLLAHSKLGNVDIKTGLFLAVGGVMGAQIGPLILQNLSDQNFKRGFAVMLIGTGAWLLFSPKG